MTPDSLRVVLNKPESWLLSLYFHVHLRHGWNNIFLDQMDFVREGSVWKGFGHFCLLSLISLQARQRSNEATEGAWWKHTRLFLGLMNLTCLSINEVPKIQSTAILDTTTKLTLVLKWPIRTTNVIVPQVDKARLCASTGVGIEPFLIFAIHGTGRRRVWMRLGPAPESKTLIIGTMKSEKYQIETFSL